MMHCFAAILAATIRNHDPRLMLDTLQQIYIVVLSKEV